VQIYQYKLKLKSKNQKNQNLHFTSSKKLSN
jgi:hypothetical protein